VLLQWQTKKCLGLDVVNLVIFISKNGKKILKEHNFLVFFFIFRKKKFTKLQKLAHKLKNTNQHTDMVKN